MEQEKFECTVAQGQVGRYLSGELLPEDNLEALEQHLAECDDCRAILNDRKQALMAMLGETVAQTTKPVTKIATGETTPAETTPAEPSAVSEAVSNINTTAEESTIDPDEIADLFEQVPAPEAAAASEDTPHNETEPLEPEIEVGTEELVEPSTATPELTLLETPEAEIDFSNLEKLDEIASDPLEPIQNRSELDGILAEAEQIQTPPEPEPVAEPEVAAVANHEEPAAGTELEEETPTDEKPKLARFKFSVNGLPALLTKNLKTMSYSLSLGIVLIAMSAFAKNPSAVFGARAIKEGEKLPESKSVVKETTQDEHAVHEETKPDAKKPEPAHETEPTKKAVPIEKHEEPKHVVPKRVVPAQPLKSYEDAPKVENHVESPPPSSNDDSEYEVAKTSGTVQKRIENGKVIHQPAPKPIAKKLAVKPLAKKAVSSKVVKRKAAASAPKKPAKRPARKSRVAKPTHQVKVYDSNGKALN
ncbi:MAG: zf-HC2 domain-containing protein [Armatimonadetes bacterium]|nr:zf-HC2 domain-containing protein [Armatimonadota bacterium]